MTRGWRHASPSDVATNPEKHGDRWELSPELGIDERLSQNHFHYHENQQELFYVVSGRCRVETPEEGFAIGWPPEGRYPVHQVEETATVRERDDA